jgi:hypothetical protein
MTLSMRRRTAGKRQIWYVTTQENVLSSADTQDNNVGNAFAITPYAGKSCQNGLNVRKALACRTPMMQN